MTYFKDAQTYVQQSLLLLVARPKTTRITTTYGSQSAPAPKAEASDSATAAPAAARAVLTLKTYDPVSGTTLKFRTDKASEVGRLMTGMRRCGRVMAGLPDVKPGEGPEGAMAASAPEPGQAEQKGKTAGGQHGAHGKPGGKDKKKKGKR